MRRELWRPGNRPRTWLERAHREEPQIQFRVFALVPEMLKRVIESPAENLVVLADHISDAFAEEPAFEIGAAREGAALGRIRAAEPQRQAQTVGEEVVDLSPFQRGLGCAALRERLDRGLAQEHLRKRLVGGTGEDRDGPPLQGPALRNRLAPVLPDREPRRNLEIGRSDRE